ncbi:MAG: SDR family NAD(P)-dependent oxidoreductase [Saprospiraceae bacterium]
MKILITGATGFVGYYIAQRLLKAGHQLTVLFRNENKGWKKLKSLSDKIIFVKGGINDYESLEEACKGQDFIVHAAGKVSIGNTEKGSLFKINVEGTANLINIAIEKNIKRFIHISSISALGGNPEQHLLDEQTEWYLKSYYNVYAQSKYQAELEVWRGSIEGLEVCILSPSVVLGPWEESHHSMEIFRVVRQGLPLFPSGASGWVDVRDLAEAVHESINKNIFHERIIINGHNASFKSVMDIASQKLGKKSPAISLPYFIAMALARILSFLKVFGIKSTITPDIIKSLYTSHQFNNKKSLELLGIQYRTLNETIDFALESMSNN